MQTLQNYRRRFDLYIDLHRDAWTEGSEQALTGTDGAEMAQLMVLIGNGEGFEEKPYYAQNLAFARALEARVKLLNEPAVHQHIGVFSVLVEVGHNRNTLQQALNALPALAEGLYSLMVKQPDPLLSQMKAMYERGK